MMMFVGTVCMHSVPLGHELVTKVSVPINIIMTITETLVTQLVYRRRHINNAFDGPAGLIPRPKANVRMILSIRGLLVCLSSSLLSVNRIPEALPCRQAIVVRPSIRKLSNVVSRLFRPKNY
jgi:hypothetical protein